MDKYDISLSKIKFEVNKIINLNSFILQYFSMKWFYKKNLIMKNYQSGKILVSHPTIP